MKILVATDGSKAWLLAVRYAVKLIGQLSSPWSSVTLVSVHDDAGLRHAKAFVGPSVVADYLRELSEKEMKPTRKVLDAARVRHDMVVHTGHVAAEIDLARQVRSARPRREGQKCHGRPATGFCRPKGACDCTDSSAAGEVVCESQAGRDANPVSSRIDARFRPLTSKSTEGDMILDDFTDDPEDPQHTSQQRTAAASQSTWVSVAVNLILTVTQVVVGVLSKSQGLVADGIHSLSDLVADFVVLFASHHSKKDADEDHPYGHQRFETAASLVPGGLLLAVGVGMSWSASRKLEEPDSVQKVHWWRYESWVASCSKRKSSAVTCFPSRSA